MEGGRHPITAGIIQRRYTAVISMYKPLPMQTDE